MDNTNTDKLQRAIDGHYAGLEAGPELLRRTRSRLELDESAPPVRRRRRPLAVAVACCLALLLGIPVLGATVPAVNAVLALVSPDLAALLMPVSGSATSNGIEISLVSAVADENALLVQLEMKDLEGGRLTDSIQPITYDVSPGSSSSSHFMTEYGEADTATLFWVYVHDGNPQGEFDLDITELSRSANVYDLIEGSWSLRLTPEQVASRSVPGTFPILDKGSRVERTYGNLRVSPVSLSFSGEEFIGSTWIDVTLVTRDGEVRDTSSLTTTWDNETFRATVFFYEAIAWDDIELLSINGTRMI